MGGKQHHPPNGSQQLVLGSPHYSSMFQFKFLQMAWHYVSFDFAVQKSHAFGREPVSLSDLEPFWLQTLQHGQSGPQPSASCWVKKPVQSNKWVATDEKPETVYPVVRGERSGAFGVFRVPKNVPWTMATNRVSQPSNSGMVGTCWNIPKLQLSQMNNSASCWTRAWTWAALPLWVWVNKLCSQWQMNYLIEMSPHIELVHLKSESPVLEFHQPCLSIYPLVI